MNPQTGTPGSPRGLVFLPHLGTVTDVPVPMRAAAMVMASCFKKPWAMGLTWAVHKKANGDTRKPRESSTSFEVGDMNTTLCKEITISIYLSIKLFLYVPA